MTTTHFLKFTDKSEALAAFVNAGIALKEDGELPTTAFVDGEAVSIDVLFGDGVIYVPNGETQTDEFGNVSPVMVSAEGYHVNVTSVPVLLAEYEIPAPAFPKCIFA